MASIPVDEKGRRRIQFTTPDKQRRSIRLHIHLKSISLSSKLHPVTITVHTPPFSIELSGFAAGVGRFIDGGWLGCVWYP